MVGFGALAGLSIGSSVLGGVLGRSDAKRAERRQMRFIQQALDRVGDQRDAIEAGRDRALPYLDQLLAESASLEDDLLGQIDPVTSAEMRRIRQERQAAEAAMSQALTSRGLDSFTTRMGQQANIDGQASNALTELGARMAAQRQSAISAGRSASLGALGSRAQFELGVGESIGSTFANEASILGGVQVQAPNTAAGIGALGGNLAALYQSSVLQKALSGASPGA